MQMIISVICLLIWVFIIGYIIGKNSGKRECTKATSRGQKSQEANCNRRPGKLGKFIEGQGGVG